jgi:hypothetical protein
MFGEENVRSGKEKNAIKKLASTRNMFPFFKMKKINFYQLLNLYSF